MWRLSFLRQWAWLTYCSLEANWCPDKTVLSDTDSRWEPTLRYRMLSFLHIGFSHVSLFLWPCCFLGCGVLLNAIGDMVLYYIGCSKLWLAGSRFSQPSFLPLVWLPFVSVMTPDFGSLCPNPFISFHLQSRNQCGNYSDLQHNSKSPQA